jgi:membrane protein
VLLTAAGYAVAVLADFLLLAYALTLLPGVRPPRRAVVEAGLLGAIGSEALKVLIAGYLRGIAGKSIYGAFGTPVALLLWIDVMAKPLLYCAAWTAVRPSGASATAADGGGSPWDSASDGVPPATPRRPPPADRR